MVATSIAPCSSPAACKSSTCSAKRCMKGNARPSGHASPGVSNSTKGRGRPGSDNTEAIVTISGDLLLARDGLSARLLQFALQLGQLCRDVGIARHWRFGLIGSRGRGAAAQLRQGLGFGFGLLDAVLETLELGESVVVDVGRYTGRRVLHALAKIGGPLPCAKSSQVSLRFGDFRFHAVELPP